MGFFLLIFSWTVLWLGWNVIAPKSLQFDPYPAFVLWLFISNMIQIFLSLARCRITGLRQTLRAREDGNHNQHYTLVHHHALLSLNSYKILRKCDIVNLPNSKRNC